MTLLQILTIVIFSDRHWHGKTFKESVLVELLSRCVNIAPISHLGRTIFYLFGTHVGIL